MIGRHTRRIVHAFALSGLYVMSACGGGGGDGTGIVQEPIVVSVTIAPPSTNPIDIDGTVQLTANVVVQNNARQTVEWSSNATSIATVNSSGLVTGLNPGAATITATSTENRTKSHSITINVNPPRVVSVALNRTSLSVGVGATATLTAAVETRGTIARTVTFTSSNTTAATVSSSDGINATVTGVRAGVPVTITATSTADATKQATVPLTVTGTVRIPSVSPSPLKVGRGKSVKLVPVVNADAGISDAVQYTSQNTAIATVANDGTVTGVALGETGILIRSVGDPTVSVTVPTTVNSGVTSVTLSTERDSVRRGGTRQLFTTVVAEQGVSQALDYSSANVGIATVNATGLITGVAVGQTYVRVLSAIDQSVGDSTLVVVIDPCQDIQRLTFGATRNGTTSAISCNGTTEIFTYTTTQQTTLLLTSTVQFPAEITPLGDKTLGWPFAVNTGQTLAAYIVAAPSRYAARVVATNTNQRGPFSITAIANASLADQCGAIATTSVTVQVPMNPCGFVPQAKTGIFYSFQFFVMPSFQAGDQLRVNITTPPPIVPYVEVLWANGTRSTANGTNQSLQQTFVAPVAGGVRFFISSVTANQNGNVSVNIVGPPSIPFDAFVFGSGVLERTARSAPSALLGPSVFARP